MHSDPAPGRSVRAVLIPLFIGSLVAAGPLVPPTAVHAQDDATQEEESSRPVGSFSGRAQVTEVEIYLTVTDEVGEVPAALRPSDFEVFEDGEAVDVVAVERWHRTVAGTRRAPEHREAPPPPGRLPVSERPREARDNPWRMVIYVDQVLSSTRSIRRSLEGLAGQAGRLADLGPVEIVRANPSPETVLRPTVSATLLEQTLRRLARETPGRDELRKLRSRFFDSVLMKGELEGMGVPIAFGLEGRGGDGPLGPTSPSVNSLDDRRAYDGGAKFADANFSRIDLTRMSMLEEADLLRRQQDALLGFAAAEPETGPRALLLINDGWDLDPVQFYAIGAPGSTNMFSLISAYGDSHGAQTLTEKLAKAMAVDGWVTVSIAHSSIDSGGTWSAEHSGRGRVGDLVVGTADSFSEIPPGKVVSPLGPLNKMAAYTGGETLRGVEKLPAALVRLRNKVRLTYQVSRPADGEVHAVEVRSRREGVKVEAPRWSGSGSPEAIAAARSRRLLEGGGERGDLPMTAAVALAPEPEPGDVETEPVPRDGRLQARVDLGPFAGTLRGGGPTPVRVTVAAAFAEGEPFVHHDRIDGQRLAELDAWTYGSPIGLPAGVEKVAVVFEELSTGAWGGSVAAIVEGDLPAAVLAAGASDHDPPAPAAGAGSAVVAGVVPGDLLPGEKALVLPPPADPVVRGKVRLEPLIASPRVAAVRYLLDGDRVAVADEPPFSTRIDFGALPELHTVVAVAVDAAGDEVGRDAVTVNEGVGAFRVRVIEPRTGYRVGSVDVEAEVKLPDGGPPLERVEVSWNGERAAMLFEPPFRTRVYVPSDVPAGYIAVTARRADGSTAEDVVFLGEPVSGDRVEIKLVELLTVVEDAEDRPVRGLERDDFTVFEDGTRQTVAEFAEGEGMPLSAGLLLDGSASMLPVLEHSQSAAIDFLLLGLGQEDRAFVAAFNERPRMLQEMTRDRRALVRAVAGLRAGGTSALCDAVVWSLVQMQGVPGRRALVVLTDGVGREERVDFTTCERFVRRAGVPLYAILLAGDDPTASNRGGLDRQTLGRLVQAVGGALFVADDPTRLGEVYRQVIQELESQYRLTYYADLAPGDEAWRDVDVEVAGPDLAARTLAGYYP